MREATELLKELGVDTFLWAGTLLGAYRGGDFIKDDSDVDIAYLSTQETPQKVAEEMAQLYYKLRERDMLADYFDENWQKHRKGDIKSVFGQAHLLGEPPYIDLFTIWNVRGETWDPWFGPMGFTLETGGVGKIKEEQFHIPKNTEQVLEFLYGDWRTPKKEKGTKYHKFGFRLKQSMTI